MIKITVHTILELKRIVGKTKAELAVPQGSTVSDALLEMVATWGEEFAQHLCDADRAGILPYMRLMVNGQDIGFLNGMETGLNDGDEITILPQIAGG